MSGKKRLPKKGVGACSEYGTGAVAGNCIFLALYISRTYVGIRSYYLWYALG